MFNEKSLKNLKPVKKGEIRNPSGKPKRLPVTEEYNKIMREKMSETTIGEKKRKEMGLKPGAIWARAVAIGMAIESIDNPQAAREMRESIEGKAIQRLRVETPEAGPVDLVNANEAEIRREVSELLKRIRSQKKGASATATPSDPAVN